jgi:hypothetical protein
MQGAAVVVTSYISLVRPFLFYSLIRKLTLLTVNTLPRQCSRETVFPDRNQIATPPRLRRQMAPIPIPLGPRSRLRLQPLRRRSRTLAAATPSRNQKSPLHVRYVQDAFGVCAIDYERVQARVNAKYDSWQQDILSRFGVKLGNAMKEMHVSILKARNELEHHPLR